jgi:tetratricopeptide (TPR) repeat protein
MSMPSGLKRVMVAVALVVAIPVARSTVYAQEPWVLEWLQLYAGGHQAEVLPKLPTVGNLQEFQDDLDKLLPTWTAAPGDPEQHRRAIIAFAVDTAFARIDQGAQSGKLAEWACRQIRRHAKPDEFDHRAYMVMFALFAGAVDPNALETHVVHVKFQFPNEPRLALERGIAEEMRGAPFYEPTKQTTADTIKHREEAARRYADAAKVEAISAEALLRLGRVNLDLGKADEALKTLDRVEPLSKDGAIVYLARLFRGMALDRLGKLDDAAQAYRQALAIGPRAQSASISLAAVTLKLGDPAGSDRIVKEALARSTPVPDPWWTYWAGDFRMGGDLIKSMREAVK